MSTLSFVMLMVCFVMGAGLVQNDKRINELELSLADIKQELSVADGAQSVFAAENNFVYTEMTTTTLTTETTAAETSTYAEDEPKTIEYKVKSGDTLSIISEKIYGTIDMMENIMQLNDLKDADSLKEGMRLVLPK